MLAMPSIATGTFVYQSFILSSKNWGPYVIAQSFMSYSIFSVVTLIFSGFLIDKFTSRKILIYMNIPLFFAAMVLFYFDKPFSSFVFFGLVGITNGLCNVLGSSTWAEIYGVKYIGSIKALTTCFNGFCYCFWNSYIWNFNRYRIFYRANLFSFSNLYFYFNNFFVFYKKKIKPYKNIEIT